MDPLFYLTLSDGDKQVRRVCTRMHVHGYDSLLVSDNFHGAQASPISSPILLCNYVKTIWNSGKNTN